MSDIHDKSEEFHLYCNQLPITSILINQLAEQWVHNAILFPEEMQKNAEFYRLVHEKKTQYALSWQQFLFDCAKQLRQRLRLNSYSYLTRLVNIENYPFNFDGDCDEVFDILNEKNINRLSSSATTQRFVFDIRHVHRDKCVVLHNLSSEEIGTFFKQVRDREINFFGAPVISIGLPAEFHFDLERREVQIHDYYSNQWLTVEWLYFRSKTAFRKAKQRFIALLDTLLKKQDSDIQSRMRLARLHDSTAPFSERDIYRLQKKTVLTRDDDFDDLLHVHANNLASENTLRNEDKKNINF